MNFFILAWGENRLNFHKAEIMVKIINILTCRFSKNFLNCRHCNFPILSIEQHEIKLVYDNDSLLRIRLKVVPDLCKWNLVVLVFIVHFDVSKSYAFVDSWNQITYTEGQ